LETQTHLGGSILCEVIETLKMVEREVKDMEGRDYSLRIRPYRPSDNRIDGAVITLIDIDGSRQALCSKGKA